MSMKAIDLQFAVHKNDEAGIRQNQLMQKPRQDEALLENQAARTVEQDRHRSAKLEESARPDVRDQGHSNRKRESGSTAKEKQASEAADSASSSFHEHPYKGHHIDLSL